MLSSEQQFRLIHTHCLQQLRQHAQGVSDAALWEPFERRLSEHIGPLVSELSVVYGQREDFLEVVTQIVTTAWNAWRARPQDLRELDARREANPDWFQSNRMLGAVCYADLQCGDLQGVRREIAYLQELGVTYLHIMPPFKCPEGQSDGGYAVSSYREVNPALGTLKDLQDLAQDLRRAGISLVLDFIFNHTSDEHEWARRCVAGEPGYEDYYILFPDRTMPDAYDRTVREIFPDQHPGAFTQLPDGRWVWTTFNSFQWDLNYANPKVFNAMAGEMLAIANVGAEMLRMDAVAFVWKQLGTSCENLPQAHHIIRAFNAVVRLGAPGMLFKSEAIVHPDDVVKYIDARECQLSYNPLQMALLWNTLATREVNLLQMALEERHHIPQGTAWVNYVRCHDDIGWTFADEDAIRVGIKGYDHRKFLNQFYVNRFPGSFARGVPFQDNPATGDCRISGTCASLCGLEQDDPHAVDRILLLHSVAMSTGGVPLIYLGDEVGTLNDRHYLEDPDKAGDSRWVHRPARDTKRYEQRRDLSTAAGRVFAGMKRMIDVRQALPAFSGGHLVGFRSGNPHVLGYMRGSGSQRVLVLANFSELAQHCESRVFSAGPTSASDLMSERKLDLQKGLTLLPYQFVWIVYPSNY